MKVLTRSSVLVLAVIASTPVMGQWSTATLSQGRWDLAATTVGTKTMFAGGYALYCFSSDVVDIHDDVGDVWYMATLAQPRSALAATTVGTKAMFGGGFDSSAPTPSSSMVDIYDDSTGMWSTAMLSKPRWALAATTVGTKAMFAGGTGPSSVVDIYDDSTGTWSTANLSQARASLVATTVGTKAMFAGGDPWGLAGVSDVVDIYDDATGTWSTAMLSQGHAALAATTVGTKAMFAGGYGAGGYVSDVVDIYDDGGDVWSTATLSQPRSWLAATTVGTQAMFAGGDVPGSSDVVDIYDDATGTWSAATLSQARGWLSATTVGTKAMFAGGQFTGNSCPLIFVCSSDTVDIYDLDFGERYCSPAVLNSTGLPGVSLAFGRTSVVENDFSLTAEQLPPNQFGYFLTSQTQGFFMPPGSQGNICLAGDIGRYNGNVGQGPSFSLQIDLTSMPVNPPVAVQPGETWNFQAWYREVGNTNNFTDAVAVTFQ